MGHRSQVDIFTLQTHWRGTRPWFSVTADCGRIARKLLRIKSMEPQLTVFVGDCAYSAFSGREHWREHLYPFRYRTRCWGFLRLFLCSRGRLLTFLFYSTQDAKLCRDRLNGRLRKRLTIFADEATKESLRVGMGLAQEAMAQPTKLEGSKIEEFEKV
jgi:hypothetical protein